MAGVEREMAHGYQTIGSLVNAFYNTRIVQNLFFAIDPDPHIRSGLISVLAGDVWRDDNAFQKKLLSSPRRWWVK